MQLADVFVRTFVALNIFVVLKLNKNAKKQCAFLYTIMID